MLEGLIVILFVLACIGGIGTQPSSPPATATATTIATATATSNPPPSPAPRHALRCARPATSPLTLSPPSSSPRLHLAAYYAMSVNQAMADDPKFQAAEQRRKLMKKKGKRDGNYSVGE